MPKRYHEISIGIDQSYKRCGISVCGDGKLLSVQSIKFEQAGDNKTLKRREVQQALDKLLQAATKRSDVTVCIVERIRTFGKSDRKFISTDYIRQTGALVAVIVDTCYQYGVPVYNVDTRCWKAQIVGTTRAAENGFGVPPEKWPTVKWVESEGKRGQIMLPVPNNSRRSKGIFSENGKRYEYDDDAADSAAIAMFWFRGQRDRLHPER